MTTKAAPLPDEVFGAMRKLAALCSKDDAMVYFTIVHQYLSERTAHIAALEGTIISLNRALDKKNGQLFKQCDRVTALEAREKRLREALNAIAVIAQRDSRAPKPSDSIIFEDDANRIRFICRDALAQTGGE
jgi:septal ring factor EnvC (AmiA/AmiB activator)